MIISEKVLPKHHDVVGCTVVSSSGAVADDGESSVSSTVTVVQESSSVEVVVLQGGGEEQQQQQQQQQQQAKRGGFHTNNGYHPQQKKSVGFDESQNQIYRNYRWSKKDCISLWYSNKDYTTFKSGTKCMAKEIARFERLNKAPHSYERVMTRAYQACIRHSCKQDEHEEEEELSSSSSNVLGRDEQKHMKKWMEISINRLGVERISIRKITKDRAARRSEMTSVVFKLQEMASTCHHHHHTHAQYYSYNDKAEVIRRACMSTTQPSRLFAHQLALAQSASLYTTATTIE